MAPAGSLASCRSWNWNKVRSSLWVMPMEVQVTVLESSSTGQEGGQRHHPCLPAQPRVAPLAQRPTFASVPPSTFAASASTLPPAKRKVPFKQLEISVRASIYPRHFLATSQRTLLPSISLEPDFLPHDCFSVHTKGGYGWNLAKLCPSLQQLCGLCSDQHHSSRMPPDSNPAAAPG